MLSKAPSWFQSRDSESDKDKLFDMFQVGISTLYSFWDVWVRKDLAQLQMKIIQMPRRQQGTQDYQTQYNRRKTLASWVTFQVFVLNIICSLVDGVKLAARTK